MMIPHIQYKGRTLVYMADLLPTVGHIPVPYVMAYDTRPLITLDEKAFIEKNELYKKEILKALDEAKLSNANFVKNEKSDADFHVLRMYAQYPSNYGYLTNNRAFKASESFPKIGDDFSMDNEELFKFSFSYRNLAGRNFYEKMYAEADSTKTPLEKGFEVFGVSLDRTKEAWVEAIEEDQLTWTQVSDLKYFNSEAAFFDLSMEEIMSLR